MPTIANAATAPGAGLVQNICRSAGIGRSSNGRASTSTRPVPMRANRHTSTRFFALLGCVFLPFRSFSRYGVKRPLPLSMRTLSTSFFASQ